MKIAIVTILSLSALSVAMAITVTAYSDSACKTLAANPVLGVPNPNSGNINTCIKSYTISGTTYYAKYTACSGTASTANSFAGDSTCSSGGTPINDAPGACIIPTGTISGVGSYKIECSSAATASVAFVSVVAAALALCF
jgi:hypothetical protein